MQKITNLCKSMQLEKIKEEVNNLESSEQFINCLNDELITLRKRLIKNQQKMINYAKNKYEK